MNLKLKASQAAMKVRKHSPVILMTAGVTGLVGTIVLASRATLQLEGIIDEHDSKLAQIQEARAKDEAGELDPSTPYDEDAAKRDKVVVYSKTVVQVVKLYLPATALGVASIAAIVSGHTVLSRRNAATMAAYTALQAGFDKYRERVREQFGEDKDKEFVQPRQVIVEEKDKDGVVRETFQFDTHGLSVYARFFDEYSPKWQKEPGYNQMFLSATQNWMNDLLNSRGHVFLNEVYDALGLERSKEGAVVGWVKKSDGDGFIDFGMDDPANEAAQEFVNGHERSILLDFNVDGLIWDKI